MLSYSIIFSHLRTSLLSFLLLTLLIVPLCAEPQEAGDPIYSSTMRRLMMTIDISGVDMPITLATDRDVYLLIYAGAGVTDIRILARSSVKPYTVAQALERSVAGTDLENSRIEYSADYYSAVKLLAAHRHFGALSGENSIPISAITTGLVRAHLIPHILLRVPLYAHASLSAAPSYRTQANAWYDSHQLRGVSDVRIVATLTKNDLLRFAAIALTAPLVMLLLSFSIRFFTTTKQLSAQKWRKNLQTYTRIAAMTPMLIMMPMVVYMMRQPRNLVIPDLWFGSETASGVYMVASVGMVMGMFCMMLTIRKETRALAVLSPTPKLQLLPEEEAIHKKMQRWTLAPHLVGAALLFVGIFLLPHKSRLYGVLHPIANLLPLVIAGIASRIYRKPLAAFVRRTADEDLTWRARQLGQQMNIRAHDVILEESSRASQVAEATFDKGNIVLTRKLVDILSPEELDFVLAHQIVMQGSSNRKVSLQLLSIFTTTIPMFILFGLVFSHRLTPLLRSTSMIAVFPIVMVLLIIMPQLLLIRWTKRNARRTVDEADRLALQTVGNADIADSALSKLDEFSAAAYGEIAARDAARLEIERRKAAIRALRTGEVQWIR